MGRKPCCDKSTGLNKGPWRTEEDQKLIKYIKENGHFNWRALPKQAGLLRCGKSCRLRWINYLRPDLKLGSFTVDEEEKIIKLQDSLGNKWAKIASHFPGRTDNEIKNIWNTYLKKRSLQSKGLSNNIGNGYEQNANSSSILSSSSASTDSPTSFCNQFFTPDQNFNDVHDMVYYQENMQLQDTLVDQIVVDPADFLVDNCDYCSWDSSINSINANVTAPGFNKEQYYSSPSSYSTTTGGSSYYESNPSKQVVYGSGAQLIEQKLDHQLQLEFERFCEVLEKEKDPLEEILLDIPLIEPGHDLEFLHKLETDDESSFFMTISNINNISDADGTVLAPLCDFAAEAPPHQNKDLEKESDGHESRSWLKYLESELIIETSTTTTTTTTDHEANKQKNSLTKQDDAVEPPMAADI